MIPVQFDYAAPESLAKAAQLLQEKEGAEILAGGHSLFQAMKMGEIAPSLLVDLGKIPGLQEVTREGNSIRIGAMTTYDRVAAAPEIGQSALAEAIASIGDVQIRNWGRIGDVFAYRDLACDLPAVALALEATFKVANASGDSRTVPASEFLVAPLQTALRSGEIVAAIDWPDNAAGTGSAYEKLKHPGSSYTVCGIAAKVSKSADGTISKCRVAVASALSLVSRLPQVEAALEGKAATPENIAAAAQLAGENLAGAEANNNIARVLEIYASAEYRSHLRKVLTERALTRALQLA